MSAERIIVPIAIREGVEARVQLPVDLTRSEADKIARVVVAYAKADRSRNGQDRADGLGSRERRSRSDLPKGT